MVHDNETATETAESITYKLSEYNIGGVVFYEHDGEKRIGRVVAVAGQTVKVHERRLFQKSLDRHTNS